MHNGERKKRQFCHVIEEYSALIINIVPYYIKMTKRCMLDLPDMLSKNNQFGNFFSISLHLQ